METNPKKQRQHFYRDYSSGQWSMSEVCDRYQISRPSYSCPSGSEARRGPKLDASRSYSSTRRTGIPISSRLRPAFPFICSCTIWCAASTNRSA